MANIKNTQFIPGVIANGLTSATKSVATINEIVQLNNENKIIHTLDELIFNSPDEKELVSNITTNGTLRSVANSGLKMIKLPGGSTVSLIKSNNSEIVDLSTLDTTVTNTLQNGRTVATINSKNINVPYATTDNGGIIKLGYSEDGKKYAVQSSDNKAFVEVPWIEYNSDGVKIVKDNNVFKHSKSSIGSNKTKALYEVAIDEYGHIIECSEVDIELYIQDYADDIYNAIENNIKLNFAERDTPIQITGISWESSSPQHVTYNGNVPSDFGRIIITYLGDLTKSISSTDSGVLILNSDNTNFSGITPGEYSIKATYNGYETGEKTLFIDKITPTITQQSQSNSIEYEQTGNIILESSTEGTLTILEIPSGMENYITIVSDSATTSKSTHTLSITNRQSTSDAIVIPAGSIKVKFTPSQSLYYNNIILKPIPSNPIQLKPEPILEPAKYLYIGTEKPTSLSQANVVTSYPTEQPYTNNSGAKSHIFVLTNSDKNVTFINIASSMPVSQTAIDTTTISGYKIFETAVGTANGGSVIIRIS